MGKKNYRGLCKPPKYCKLIEDLKSIVILSKILFQNGKLSVKHTVSPTVEA